MCRREGHIPVRGLPNSSWICCKFASRGPDPNCRAAKRAVVVHRGREIERQHDVARLNLCNCLFLQVKIFPAKNASKEQRLILAYDDYPQCRRTALVGNKACVPGSQLPSSTEISSSRTSRDPTRSGPHELLDHCFRRRESLDKLPSAHQAPHRLSGERYSC